MDKKIHDRSKAVIDWIRCHPVWSTIIAYFSLVGNVVDAIEAAKIILVAFLFLSSGPMPMIILVFIVGYLTFDHWIPFARNGCKWCKNSLYSMPNLAQFLLARGVNVDDSPAFVALNSIIREGHKLHADRRVHPLIMDISEQLKLPNRHHEWFLNAKSAVGIHFPERLPMFLDIEKKENEDHTNWTIRYCKKLEEIIHLETYATSSA